MPQKPQNTFEMQVPLTELIDSLGNSKSSLSLYVNKSDFTLSVMNGEKALRTYPIVLGAIPVDDKRKEGDMCTPEGTFSIRDLYPHQRWTYFIWIDYPNAESWTKFNASMAEGELESDDTIGGEVGIHGVPSGKDHWVSEGQNWTHGCMSLDTKGIKDLYPVCYKGMKVLIEK